MPLPTSPADMPILIAEDNEAQCRYLRDLITGNFPSHSPVIEARDGQEAVKIALDERPALSILDIQMPKLSGVKAARAIWRDFPEARIIFWTQFDQTSVDVSPARSLDSTSRRDPPRSMLSCADQAREA